MSTTELEMFQVFRSVFDERHARGAVKTIKSTVKDELHRHLGLLATKHDLYETKVLLRKEMSDMRDGLRKEMSDMRDELRKEISNLRDELRKEISDLKTDLMKFMLAQTVVIIGVVIALIKLL